MPSTLITSLINFGKYKSIDDAIKFVNDHGIQHNVFQFIYNGRDSFVIIFGFSDYPGYLHFCQKMAIKPIDTNAFFSYHTNLNDIINK